MPHYRLPLGFNPMYRPFPPPPQVGHPLGAVITNRMLVHPSITLNPGQQWSRPNPIQLPLPIGRIPTNSSQNVDPRNVGYHPHGQ